MQLLGFAGFSDFPPCHQALDHVTSSSRARLWPNAGVVAPHCPDVGASAYREVPSKPGVCQSSCPGRAAAAMGSASGFIPWDPASPSQLRAQGGSIGLHRSQLGLARAGGQEDVPVPAHRLGLPVPMGAADTPCAPGPGSGERDPGQEKGFYTSALPSVACPRFPERALLLCRDRVASSTCPVLSRPMV